MIKLLLFILPLVLLSACVNKRGISTKYYNKCHEYYDYQSNYHKVCDNNEIIEKKSITKSFHAIGDFLNTDQNEGESEKNVW